MASTSTPTRRAFYEAFRSGDLAVIEAFLAQPHICAHVARAEACIAAHRPVVPSSKWFLEDAPRPYDPYRRQPLLFEAARHGQAHVLAWFYAPERVATMGATLAAELRTLARCTDMPNVQYWPAWTGYSPELVEILLSSEVFRRFFTDDEQQRVLQDLVEGAMNPAVVALAVAHGARLGDDATLDALAQLACHVNVIDAAVHEGAFVVGAPRVLEKCLASTRTPGAVAARFMAHGVDWGNGTGGVALRTAVHHLVQHRNSVFAFVDHGFVDVDACDATDGVTALMGVASHSGRFERMFPHMSRSVAEVLLAHGADQHRTNAMGETALDYAIRADNRVVAQLLRAHGVTAQSERLEPRS